MGTMETSDVLSQALFPKARRAVLGLLFSHPDQAFFFREIVVLTGLGVGHVQRELDRLVNAGVLKAFAQGRHKYFQADHQCPIYQELHSLTVKTFGVAQVIKAELKPVSSRISIAFIYGSVARSEENRASDVDLMLLGDVTLLDVASICRGLEMKIQRQVNPTVYPVEEFKRKLEQKNHFLSSVVAADKMFVIGGPIELQAILGQRLD